MFGLSKNLKTIWRDMNITCIMDSSSTYSPKIKKCLSAVDPCTGLICVTRIHCVLPTCNLSYIRSRLFHLHGNRLSSHAVARTKKKFKSPFVGSISGFMIILALYSLPSDPPSTYNWEIRNKFIKM